MRRWRRGRGHGRSCFAIACGADMTVFSLVDGVVQAGGGEPAFTLAAPDEVWGRFLLPVPPRHYHGIFAMHYRVPEFSIQGDTLAFMQHAHVARRVLEIGKWLALGQCCAGAAEPGAAGGTSGGARGPWQAMFRWRSVGLRIRFTTRPPGSGRDVLCMHTAGSDGRQFHGLMADQRITEGHRLVAFDLPWHGKSPPPEGAVPGSWRLNTDLVCRSDHGVRGRGRAAEADRAGRIDVRGDLPGTGLPPSRRRSAGSWRARRARRSLSGRTPGRRIRG